MKKSKTIGLLILLTIYIVAVAAGIGTYFLLQRYSLNNILLEILICDVISTFVVWLFGVIFKTASTYDPYWSVQTIIIYILLLIKFNNWNLGTILFLVPLAIYTIRLTGNFIYTFDSLSYIDWRYRMLKEKTGFLYQIVNLLGICMFPTLVVYSASIPAFLYAVSGSFNALQIIGIIVMLGAVALEFVSDYQMHYFRKHRQSRDEIINVGLWKYSRHPNYLGEITFWFGLFLVFFVNNIWGWYFVSGAVINLLMFLFISIPMEENHMKEYKPNLTTYIESVSMLLILPKKKANQDE